MQNFSGLIVNYHRLAGAWADKSGSRISLINVIRRWLALTSCDRLVDMFQRPTALLQLTLPLFGGFVRSEFERLHPVRRPARI
jgi:hypothetical protein